MSEMVHITFGHTVIAVRRDLSLPNDLALRDQLEGKLQEYRQRLLAPNMTPHREASTNYKIWVLQQLLDQGILDFLHLKAAVAKDATNQTLAIAYLAYAWKVIENYCHNRGAQNRGGTGLPTGSAAIAPAAPVDGLVLGGDQSGAPSPAFDPLPMVAVPMDERPAQPRPSRITTLLESDADPAFGQQFSV